MFKNVFCALRTKYFFSIVAFLVASKCMQSLMCRTWSAMNSRKGSIGYRVFGSLRATFLYTQNVMDLWSFNYAAPLISLRDRPQWKSNSVLSAAITNGYRFHVLTRFIWIILCLIFTGIAIKSLNLEWIIIYHYNL